MKDNPCGIWEVCLHLFDMGIICIAHPKLYEPGQEKIYLMSYANNKGADQPAHPRRLINAFVARCLDSVMSLASVTKISSLMLASESDLVGNSRRHIFS